MKLHGLFQTRSLDGSLPLTSSALRRGSNTLEVKVTNLWINRLIGDESQPDDCKWFENGALAAWPEWLVAGKPRPSNTRIAFTTWKHWKATDIPPPSGLRGPVVLRHARRIELKQATEGASTRSDKLPAGVSPSTMRK